MDIETKKLYSIGNLFNDSLSIIRKNIKFLVVVAIILIVLNIIANFIAPVMKYKEPINQPIFDFYLNLLFNFYRILPFFIIYGVISAIPNIALIFAIDNLSDGSSVTIGKAFAKGLEKFLPYLWVYILMTFFIELGFVFLFIPGIIIGLWLIFSTIALVLEDKKNFTALKRSRQLVRGNLLYVFGISLYCGFFCWIIMGILLGLFFTISHFITRFPGNYISYFFSVGIGIYNIPVIIIYILVFKNLRDIKGNKTISISD